MGDGVILAEISWPQAVMLSTLFVCVAAVAIVFLILSFKTDFWD